MPAQERPVVRKQKSTYCPEPEASKRFVEMMAMHFLLERVLTAPSVHLYITLTSIDEDRYVRLHNLRIAMLAGLAHHLSTTQGFVVAF